MRIGKLNCKTLIGSKVFVGLGASALFTGSYLDGFDSADLRTVGAVVVTASVVRLAMCPAMKPPAEMYEAGHDIGYNHGYRDGEHDGRRRHTLVALRVPDDRIQRVN